jgi:hypothetical protein
MRIFSASSNQPSECEVLDIPFGSIAPGPNGNGRRGQFGVASSPNVLYLVKAVSRE